MERISILHLITELEPAGAELLLVNIAKKLNKELYDVSVAYIYGQGTLAGELRKAGIEVYDLSRRGKIDALIIIKLLLLIRKKKIQVIHTHLVHAGILGKFAARLTGVKHILTTRHYGYEHKENSLLYRLEERLSNSSSVVIAISNMVKRYLIARNVIPENKIIVIHNAIDLEPFNSNPITQISRKDNSNMTIGSIGRLHPQKGFTVLLESFRLVNEEIPNVILEIVGDGALREKLQDQARELDIADKVRFIGCIPHREVPQRLSQWDLFVLSSEWEGFGIAIIEAMAMEKAVVATNVEGIVEIVDDGITGYLVPPRSPKFLASKIIELLTDEAKRVEMGKTAREKVSRYFSIDRYVKKIENVYDSLLNG